MLKDSASFLFTIQGEIIAQFPVTTAIIHGRNPLDIYMKPIAAALATKVKIISPSIVDLKVGMKRLNIEVEVLQLSEPHMVYTRYGSTAMVSRALVTDKTGSMRMSLWNRQRTNVHEGDTIAIKNGRVGWYSGERYLNVGRGGSLTVVK
jgi:replication factor A1